jgi:hypothetical protein
MFFVIRANKRLAVIAHAPRRQDKVLAASESLDDAFRVLKQKEAEPDLWDRWIHRVSAIGIVLLILFAPAIFEREEAPAEAAELQA